MKGHLVVQLFGELGLDIDSRTGERFASVIQDLARKMPKPSLYVERNGGKPGVVCKVDAVPISSFCKHHILPWFGYVEIQYTPKAYVLGLSKFKRLVDWCSQGLALQEDVTEEIYRQLKVVLETDVRVEIKAKHTCVLARGVNLEPSFEFTTVREG